MRRRLGWSLAAVLAGCDAPATACEDGVADVGALCLPPDAALRVGYGFAPAAMVAADVDGDGAVDVAAANPSSRTLTIAWGPDRVAATSWSIGEEIAGLALGDVDGDGRMDVVTALPERDAVAVLRGAGGRGLERARDRSVGDSPRAVLVADLDGDGAGEVLAGCVGDGRVWVDGTAVVVGTGPRALAAGDVDGDGDVDVGVALADAGAVQVLVNDGRGGLLAGARIPVGAGPLAIVAGDLDGDGADELATADALADTVTVIDGEATRAWPVARPTGLVVVRDAALPGLGVLSEGTDTVTRLDPRTGAAASTLTDATAVAAGDVDGDGRAALVAGSTGATAAVRRGAADGLVLAPTWEVAAWHGGVTPIDADGDGIDEVLIDGEQGPQLVNGASGAAIGEPIALAGFGPRRVLVPADVDGDGREDVVVVGTMEDGSTAVGAVETWLQAADGTFVAAGPITLTGTRAYAAVAGDFEGDGGTDLAVLTDQFYESTLWLLGADERGGWEVLRMGTPSGFVSVLVAAELDGDAAMELTMLEANAGEEAMLWWDDPVNGDGADLFPVNTRLSRGMAVASLGDEGMTAILCGAYGVQRVREVGRVYAPELLSAEPCGAVAMRDGDGDGDVDVLVLEEGDGSAVTLWRNDGSGALAVASRTPVGRPTAGFAFAELDGGPAPEVVTSDEVLTTAWRGAFAPVLLAEERREMGGEVAGAFADMNGDGVLDRVQVGPGVAVALATGDGGFAAWRHASFERLADPDVGEVVDLAGGDVEGDGADEMVVLADIPNVLSLRAVTVVRVDADGAPQGETVARLASRADQVLVADLDGDGAEEIVVADGMNNVVDIPVTVLRAGDGYMARTQFVAALPGQSAVLGLYDVRGDGVLDLIVSQGSLRVAHGQGDGSFGAAGVWARINLLYKFWMGDLDGDRAVDLLALRTNGSDDLLLLRGGSDPSRTPQRLVSDVDTAALADIDGDGVLEVLAANGADADWPVTLKIGRAAGGGDYVFESRPLPESGAGAVVQEVVAHDWDGDERADVAVVDETGFTIVRQRP